MIGFDKTDFVHLFSIASVHTVWAGDEPHSCGAAPGDVPRAQARHHRLGGGGGLPQGPVRGHHGPRPRPRPAEAHPPQARLPGL